MTQPTISLEQAIGWIDERIDASIRAPNSNIVIHREKAAHIRNFLRDALKAQQAKTEKLYVPELDYELACESFRGGSGGTSLDDDDICQGIRAVLRDQDVAIATAHKLRAALTEKAGDAKDASRYRFLRAQWVNQGGVLAVVKPRLLPLGIQTYSGDLLDFEVDAEMTMKRAAIAAAKDGA